MKGQHIMFTKLMKFLIAIVIMVSYFGACGSYTKDEIDRKLDRMDNNVQQMQNQVNQSQETMISDIESMKLKSARELGDIVHSINNTKREISEKRSKLESRIDSMEETLKEKTNNKFKYPETDEKHTDMEKQVKNISKYLRLNAYALNTISPVARIREPSVADIKKFIKEELHTKYEQEELLRFYLNRLGQLIKDEQCDSINNATNVILNLKPELIIEYCKELKEIYSDIIMTPDNCEHTLERYSEVRRIFSGHCK